ncbi:MAG TPA: adenylate cyclase regulatory domain-containing protein [Thermoleophilaceae bacterium]|nr:adenylate cyclase regulatory domain-containing protein [Thermoleophilaceae bacterium]
MATDFEADGLLEGLEGQAREARLELLRQLESEGVPTEELRAASAEGRLALVPVERILVGDSPHYTAAEVAERSGMEPEFLDRYWRAIGMTSAGPDDPAFVDDDVDAARRLDDLRDAGLGDDEIIEMARVMSSGMSTLAVTIARVFADTYLQEGDDEASLSVRFAEAAQKLLPLLGPALEHALMVQNRSNLRQASAIGSSLAEGRLPDQQEVSVAFADLVDFTKLGESVDPGRLGAVAAQLEELTRDVIRRPVRLVKTIGDEVMLESADTVALLEAALDLLDAADRQDDEFPQIAVGIARGPAISRGGDLFGHSVNLASRVTATARPGSVLVTQEVRDAAGEDAYRYSFAGERKLKGVKDQQKLFRVRRVQGDD